MQIVWTILFLLFLGVRCVFAQSPSLTVERCINSNPDCNGVVNNPGEIAIRWTTDPSSGSSDPVTRVYLHGPFNTVEGTTPADPGHPDALCAGIGQGWDDQSNIWQDVDGTLCNFDDGTCLLPTPADGSSDPLSGMREPHCRLNICGNGGDGFDREVCSSTPSDGTKAILVDGARESGSYFLVFEKESGAVEIATQHYDPLPPSCGEVTAAIHPGNSPSVDVTLNPTNANRIAVTGCGRHASRALSGDGSQTFNCPFRGTQKTITFACQGAGDPDRRKVQVSLGTPTVQIDPPGYNPAASEPVTVNYHVSRPSSVTVFRTTTIHYRMFGSETSFDLDLPTSSSSGSVPWVRGAMDETGGYYTLTSSVNPVSGRQLDPVVMSVWSTLQRHLAGNQGNYSATFTRNHSNCIFMGGAVDFNGREYWNSVNLCDFPVSFNATTAGQYAYDRCIATHTSNPCGDNPSIYCSNYCSTGVEAYRPADCFSMCTFQCSNSSSQTTDGFHCDNFGMDVTATLSGTNITSFYYWCDGWSSGSLDLSPSADRYDLQVSHFSTYWQDPWRGHLNGDHPTGRCVFQALTYDGRWINPDNNPNGWWNLAMQHTECDGRQYSSGGDCSRIGAGWGNGEFAHVTASGQ